MSIIRFSETADQQRQRLSRQLANELSSLRSAGFDDGDIGGYLIGTLLDVRAELEQLN
jgi:hypothetical protein